MVGSTTHYHSLILFFLLLSPAAAATADEQCNAQDKKALLGIQKYYNIFTSWNASTDCCTYWSPVVECDATTHRITSFAIFTDFLRGAIAPAIGDLPFLKSLDIRKQPNLTGPIPNSLAKLHNLEFLRLDWNSLTGSVPDFFHTLKKLNYINLSFNKLSGSIPPSLALTPSLDYLRLDRNRLTGSIPDTFGSVKNGELYGLYLSHNQLSGPIPASMGKVNFTNVLDLSRNQLIGDASFLFGKTKTVLQMDLSRNQLAFDMSNIEVPSEIEWLLLDHNNIYGSLPSSLTELEGSFTLDNFNVSYNRLCGKIPTGGKLGEFDKYSFFHNKCLCGSPLDACK